MDEQDFKFNDIAYVHMLQNLLFITKIKQKMYTVFKICFLINIEYILLSENKYLILLY